MTPMMAYTNKIGGNRTASIASKITSVIHPHYA
jgi:hypothetical protein